MQSMSFPFRLSMQVAIVSTLLVAVVGTALAYVLARRRFPGRELLDTFVTLPLVFPPVVTGYYLVGLVGRRGVLGRALHAAFGIEVSVMFTWYAAVLAAFTISLPLMVKTARAAIESVDTEMIDASALLGRTEAETALRVVLPLAGKGIMAGVMLAFARALGEFGATVMLAGNIPGRTNTMPLEIYNAVLYGDWRRATVMVLFFTVVSVALLLAAGRLGRVLA